MNKRLVKMTELNIQLLVAALTYIIIYLNDTENLRLSVKSSVASVSSLQCPKPVVVAVHGACVGGGE